MKIGIMTFHWSANYGAVMQAYALSEYLKREGAEPYVIDYYPARLKKNLMNALPPNGFSSSLIPYIVFGSAIIRYIIK